MFFHRCKIFLIAWALALSAFAPASGQTAADQYVESLADHKRKIEGLINERLTSLLPSQQFVSRVEVQGEEGRVPTAPEQAVQLELPGFRPSRGDTLPGKSMFKISRVSVRIVVNASLHPSDQRYLRTIVPILADFRPERGDSLDLQVIDPAAPADATAGEAGQPGSVWPPLNGAQSLLDSPWVLIGLLGLILLILLFVMVRLIGLSRRKAQPEPAPMALPPQPPAREDRSHQEEQRRLKQEEQLDALRHGVVKRIFARPVLGRELILNWQSSPAKINSLIHGIGPDIARHAVMEHLGRERYQELEETVLQETPPDISRLVETMREANLFLISQEITHPELISPNPFGFLDKLTWGQISHLIKDEPVNVKAIVLSRIKAEDSARVMESLPREAQLEVAVQIGNLHDMPLNMAESVAKDLAEKSKHVPDARLVDIEGANTLVDVMGQTSTETSRQWLEGMKSKDTKLSEEVEKRFFLFEAIPLVPDEVLPQAVRTMPSGTVVTALQGASKEIQRKVILAFPEQARNGLVMALRASQNDQATVDEARRQVVAQFQRLAKQGRIDLKQISDAWQAQAS